MHIRAKILFIASLMAFFLCFFPSGSRASEASYEKHLAKGVAGLDANDFGAAVREFKAALNEKPDDAVATLYLGIVLSRSGDKDAGAVLRKALSMRPSDPRANLELGVYDFDVMLYTQAREYFESAARLAPGTEISATAEEYLERMKQRGIARRWSLDLSLGGQYDSNVILNPDVGPLPQGISGKSDWRAVAYLRGRYTIFASNSVESSVGYNLYQSLHAKLSDFNVSQHVFDLSTTYRITPVLRLRGIYSFEYVLVGGNGYDFAHMLAPALVFDEGKGFSSTIEYRYRKEHFMNASFFTDNSDRTGSDNLIEISQVVPLHRTVLARAAYSYDVDSTEKDFWHYNGNRVAAGLTVTLPWRMLMNADGEYYNKNYEGISPLSGSRRKDDIYTASLSLTKALDDRYSVTAGQIYVRNKSNISDFDYKRNITSLFLNARF